MKCIRMEKRSAIFTLTFFRELINIRTLHVSQLANTDMAEGKEVMPVSALICNFPEGNAANLLCYIIQM